MENFETRIRKNGLKNGLLLGVVMLALSIISYYFIISATKPQLLFLATPTFKVILPVAAVILIGFNLRKTIGGYWDFKQATTGVFIMLLTAYVIQMVGSELLFAKIVAPEMQQKIAAAYIKAELAIRSTVPAYEKKIDQNIQDIKRGLAEQRHITIGHIVQGMAFSIIFIFVFSLIFGALFKRDRPPVYSNEAGGV